MSRKLTVLMLTGGLVVGYFVSTKLTASHPVVGVSDSEVATTSVTEIKSRPVAAFAPLQTNDQPPASSSKAIVATSDPDEPEFLRKTCRFYANATNMDFGYVMRSHQARLRDLPPTLAPEEVRYQREVENKSFELWNIFHEQLRLRLSEEEFKHLFSAFEDLQWHDGLINHPAWFPPAGEQKIKELLRPDAYQQYLDSQLVENRFLIMFAKMYDLDDDTFDEIPALRDSAPSRRDRQAFQAYSNSISTLLEDRLALEHGRHRRATEHFFSSPLYFMRPKKQR